LSEKEVRSLKLGDKLYLTGTIFTARDQAHKYLSEQGNKELVAKLNNGIIYHCGPIVKKTNKDYEIIAAGPTTSARLSSFAPELIKKLKIKAFIGKGGMDKKTLAAMKKYGCVYLSAVGGAAALLADSIKKVTTVYKPEFGIPEAIWQLEVEKFPVIVTMDAKGNSLHEEIYRTSLAAIQNLQKYL